MATASQASFQMRSADLIKKEALDSGGFGEVYLCYHVTLGQVVMKTMYTGPIITVKSQRSLLDEGKIMASLSHERVVKLLGVIIEDRDCSLVMELIPRGNLAVMLETVPVPISIKGRIILEILEGMVYLTERRVIHKDIKPGNILVDKDFHIKIADLGLATCLTWSKLTREESRRRSCMGRSAEARGAGTLSYMAPEHLKSVHTASTEKSDVYSFAIVVWVVLAGIEPYANARSEEQLSQCIRHGDRPAESLLPEEAPVEMTQLMTRCWDHSPLQRPTFQEGYNFFLPFYTEKLEPHVEEDLLDLRESYEGPEELVEKMKSLSMDYQSADCPAPLVSSDRSGPGPVETSIEDMHDIQNEPSLGSVQADAKTTPSALEVKLGRELQYHKHGSYHSESRPDDAHCLRHSSSNPFLQNHVGPSDHGIRQPEPDRTSFASSVHSWTKAEPVQPTSQEEGCYRPTASLYESMNSAASTPSHYPSLSPANQQHPLSHYDRQQSWPVYPVSDTAAPGLPLTPCKQQQQQQDSASLFINNASGIQIGSNNTMNISGYESTASLMSLPGSASATSPIKEGILKYEDRAVSEEHLDLLRDNIGATWKRCARRLGLTDVEIETIEHDCDRYGLPEMVHQMLERWKMKEGSIGYTVGKLCHALEGLIKVDVIQKILDTCGSAS
ncbi:receptor-interacting serine/threonine-protein kinase 1 isoform X2 [Pseudoliparis swirei]|uniref:receptor-interacting serine/threonine-protein kinase 1 isoform X2 n=1 Tax=Pseudoliparis swirei TaxID=2059687 RepID=UPI0024BED574|nr:receptor-interacting serine/threonine-protein kinase 1 isoform X2 [Pseudoliparis swirei]